MNVEWQQPAMQLPKFISWFEMTPLFSGYNVVQIKIVRHFKYKSRISHNRNMSTIFFDIFISRIFRVSYRINSIVFRNILALKHS